MTISSPTMMAGATGRSRAKYSSVRYSPLGLDMISIVILFPHVAPNLGSIVLKCLHGPPLGSFRKNRTFSIAPPLAHLLHPMDELWRLHKIHEPHVTPFNACCIQKNHRGDSFDRIVRDELIARIVAGGKINFHHNEPG